MAASTPLESVFDVKSFIDEYYCAWGGTDEDVILSYYRDDIVLQIPGLLIEGKDALRDQFVRPFIAAFPGNHHLVKNMIFGPGVVTVEFSFEACHTGPFEGQAATGAQISLPGCGVYEYDSAKRQITAARIYMDMGTLLQTIIAFPTTDSRKAVDASQLNEGTLSLIVNTIPTTAWTTRPDGYCDFLNQRWLDYARMTAEQAVGWGWAEAIHPDDRARLIDYWHSCLASGVPVEAEGRMRRFDGCYRWFLFRANPVRDASGRIVKWYGTNIDIDDRKGREEALRASERNLSLTLNSISTFIAVCGPDGTILSLNQAALDYHGITFEDVQKKDFRSRWFHPDDIERLTEELREALPRPQRFECEYRALGKDGNYRWFLVRYNPLLDDQGRIERWYVIAFDIEDQKRTEEALRKSENQFRLLVETIPALVWRSTPEGDLDYLNGRAVEYLGHTAESLAGGRWVELVHPDYRDATLKRWLQSATTGTPYEDEYQLRRADGQYRWIRSVGEPFLDTEGRIANWYGLVLDIEDRKRAEDALVRQAGVRADVSAAFTKPTHLREILRGCTEAIVRHLNAAFARIWMLNKDENMLELQASAGMYTRLDGSYSRIPIGELKVGRIAQEKKAHLTNDLQNDPRVHDKGWAKDNGMTAFAGYPLAVEDRLIGVVALFARHTLSETILETLASVADTIAQGIERMRAEEALRIAHNHIQKSESKLRQVIDAIPTLAWCGLPDGSNEFLNKVWHEYTGLSPEQSHGWGWQIAFHPDDLPPLMEKWMKMLASGESDEIEARIRRYDGVYRWFLIRAQPFRDESGKILRWYGTSTDIDDRKRAEMEIEQAHARLAEAQELSKTGSFITDLLADDHNWSEEAFRIFEFDPETKVTVQMVRDTVHPDDLPSFDAIIARGMAGTDVDFVFRIVTARGAVKHVRGMARVMEQIEGRPLFIGALQDITESKVAEEALSRARAELAHMARVTTLSELTASISHEINQPIAATITNANACLRWLTRDQPNLDEIRSAVERIRKDGQRTAEIIARLRSLYKKGSPGQHQLVDINAIVNEMLVLLRTEANSHSIIMRTELVGDLPPVRADRVQLQQVFMNLMLNGIEAMETIKGEMTIKTQLDGSNVLVSISDTGVGLFGHNLDKIFESFFTTKSRGTGMGLSISRSIIEAHGGQLWATNNDARGAIFYFTLPAAKREFKETPGNDVRTLADPHHKGTD
jgi:PAS domain S-box-containing protein